MGYVYIFLAVVFVWAVVTYWPIALAVAALGVALLIARSRRPAGAVEESAAVAVTLGRSTGSSRRGDGPPRLHPSQAAILPSRPADWPQLPPIPVRALVEREYVAVEDRPYARTDCPHCGAQLDPLPKAKKKCPSCKGEIFVKSGPDKRRYLLTAAERPAMEARWQAAQSAEYEAVRVRAEAEEEAWLDRVRAAGITVGDDGLDVVGESFYLAALVPLVERYPDRVAVARLEREPGNKYDRNAIRVLIDGVQVGHLSRDDAEAYQPMLKASERSGRPLFLVARLIGGELEEDGMYGPVGVVFDHAPEVPD